jgi:hypothetical protein
VREDAVASLDQPAGVLETTGHSEDGWCEPSVNVTVVARAEVAICQLEVWLMPEPQRTTSILSIRFGDEDGTSFEIPHGVITVVQGACRGVAGDVIGGVLECDNLVSDKGSDLRPLSFKIVDRIRFF